MAKKNKAAPTSSGSRTITYVLVILIAVLVFYYVILPDFTPPASSGTVTTSTVGTNFSVSLTPSTDIAGTMVTVSGQNLPRGQVVNVTFDNSPRQLTNSTGAGGCRTSSSGALAGCNFWVPSGSASGAHDVKVAFGAGASALATFTVPQYNPPGSTVLVTLTSVALGLITQVVTRRVVDLNKERRMRAELNAFNKEKREATLANDKAKLEKLKKRELSMRQEQAKVSTARLKVTAITFIPLLLVYYLMATFLGGYGVIVAYTSIPIPVIAAPTQTPGLYVVSLFWGYFLRSFTVSTMLTRLLHARP